MNHLSMEELTDMYYGSANTEIREHLQQCGQCAGRYEALQELLRAVRDVPLPEPGPGYEREVWAKLLPRLPERKPFWSWISRPLVFAPALAALLAVAFLAGMLTQRHQYVTGISTQARERVLLISLSDHLERSQVLLTELLTASPETLDLADESRRARDLLEENRLLRQASTRAGDLTRSNTLDDLERILLALANSPSNLSTEDIQALQTRIRNDGLLFKVRVTSAGTRHEGQI